MSEIPKLLTIADIAERWQMARQSVHERHEKKGFPKPIQYVAKGRTAIFLEEDIQKFEEEHPWIADPARRERRQRFMFSLLMKDEE